MAQVFAGIVGILIGFGSKNICYGVAAGLVTIVLLNIEGEIMALRAELQGFRRKYNVTHRD